MVGLANSSDKERLEAFLRRCIRLQLYRQRDPTLNQLDLEDKLFTIITLITLGLGDMNLHWRLKAMLETFLKDSYSKT